MRLPYRDRYELAKEAVKAGLGWEDVQVKFGLFERDARFLVFDGKHEQPIRPREAQVLLRELRK